MVQERPDQGEPRLRSSFVNWYNQLSKQGFFRYMGKNVILIFGVYVVVIFIVFLIGKYLVDFNSFFQSFIDRLSDRFVIFLFFASESFTGMVPVDLFVIWAQKFDRPLPYLALLGILSYAGGVISYGIGSWVSRWPKIKGFTERRLENYIELIRKWGGAYIVIAALFPFTPFSLVVIAITLLKYPFRLFLLFALARLVRFVIQGVFFFDLLKVDSWIG